MNAPADLYIINRENIDWLVNNTKFDYDMVVIDELSSFKSHQSKRFKALMKVRPNVKRIVGLTGTPASNGLMDLWAEFRLLDMGAAARQIHRAVSERILQARQAKRLSRVFLQALARCRAADL